MLLCALGDLVLDVVVRLDGPIAPDTDAYGQTRVGAGGQAANVAAWAVALGESGRVIAKRGDDAAGRVLGEELARRGVDLAGPVAPRGTGTVVSLATPDGRRTMLSDRGVSSAFAPEDLRPEWLAACDRLHVSGYALAREPAASTALAAGELVARVSVDVASTAAVRECGRDRFRALVARLRPDVVFATEEEEAVAGPLPAATVVVKRGAGGCVVRRNGAAEAYAAAPARVVDTTGAGDAFAAGFLVGGPELALEAAARCVGRLGAMP